MHSYARGGIIGSPAAVKRTGEVILIFFRKRAPRFGRKSGKELHRYAVNKQKKCMKHAAKCVALALSAVILLAAAGCAADTEGDQTYGVFLSVTEDLQSLGAYETVVIDAQYFSKEEIGAFRDRGHRVYTYLNVGSLEDFRSYYDTYKDLILSPCEHWEEESWIDVSSGRWQTFILRELVPELLEKNVDGFFVDNCDVYFQYPEQPVMDGLTLILRALVGTGRAVLLNGGDVYLDAYCGSGGSWADVITGINQETVFSKILWHGNRFGKASAEDRAYFTDYIERYAAEGAEIYLLEYTRSSSLKAQIVEYCREHGFSCYISDSVELD